MSHRAPAFYSLAWRWHVYAGLFVIPCLILLSLTALVIMCLLGAAFPLVGGLLMWALGWLLLSRHVGLRPLTVDSLNPCAQGWPACTD
jgi:uncharacterized iron-regulated membrane protein